MTCFSSPADCDALNGEPEMNDLMEWIAPEVLGFISGYTFQVYSMVVYWLYHTKDNS